METCSCCNHETSVQTNRMKETFNTCNKGHQKLLQSPNHCTNDLDRDPERQVVVRQISSSTAWSHRVLPWLQAGRVCLSSSGKALGREVILSQIVTSACFTKHVIGGVHTHLYSCQTRVDPHPKSYFYCIFTHPNIVSKVTFFFLFNSYVYRKSFISLHVEFLSLLFQSNASLSISNYFSFNVFFLFILLLFSCCGSVCL